MGRRIVARGKPGVALVAVTCLLLPLALPAHADHAVTTQRVAGETRFDTAAQVAALTYPEGAEVALLSRADEFADALAGAYAAGLLEAPLLLSSQEEVPPQTLEALEALEVETVVLLGGHAALSEDIETQLDDLGYAVQRVSGATRFETAAAVAVEFGAEGVVGELDGLRTAVVANGRRFPDALAVGPLSAGAHFPLLLTEREQASTTLHAALEELDVEQVLLVGGTAVIAPQVATELEDEGYEVSRVSGPNRMATAAAVADLAVVGLGWDPDLVVLTRGDAFPDALAAGPHAGRAAAPILLSADPGILGDPTAEWLAIACPGVHGLLAVGGQGAVSEETLARASGAADLCHEPGAQTYVLGPQPVHIVAPGETVELAVEGRFDEDALAGPLELMLFPCRAVDAMVRPTRFKDETGDGRADGRAGSDTGSALIDSVHGQPTGSAWITGAVPDADGRVPMTATAEEADCAVLVVFADENDNQHLDVDADGVPTEPFGLARISWR